MQEKKRRDTELASKKADARAAGASDMEVDAITLDYTDQWLFAVEEIDDEEFEKLEAMAEKELASELACALNAIGTDEDNARDAEDDFTEKIKEMAALDDSEVVDEVH